MIPPLGSALRAFHLGLLHGASLLVPHQRRSEWLQEWRTELWYVLRECLPAPGVFPRPVQEATVFCLGAYQDALCIRKQLRQRQLRLAPVRSANGSASICLLLLFASLIVSWCVTFLSSRVRAEQELSRYRVYSWSVLHGDARSPKDQFRTWLGGRQRFFDEVEFYRITNETILAAPHEHAEWAVAHASPNLFAMLPKPARFAMPVENVASDLPMIVLSDEAWKRDFRGNAKIAGSVVSVSGHDARIAGVALRGSWKLPGKIDAWLLESDSEVGTAGERYVVARLTPHGDFEMGPRWAITFFAVLLAVLSLPVTTSLSTGEYSLTSPKPSPGRRVRRWCFLGTKIALLLPIAYFASLDMAYSLAPVWSPRSGYLQFASSFLICLFGLRWTFRDQRQRCPVCLRRIAHPARVGQPSRNFLAWNGTELICVDGHTLLHVPEFPTSWFDAQRWLCLDASWQFLFTGSGTPAIER